MTTEAAFAAAHVDRSGEFVLPLPLVEALPLFTPEGERACVPGWEPEYLHPPEPSDAAGMVRVRCVAIGGATDPGHGHLRDDRHLTARERGARPVRRRCPGGEARGLARGDGGAGRPECRAIM